MYQVIAEAVNGSQVLSRGRWLTCIGNKPVKKGDRVWTDGKCVYGFYNESSTPFVIVNPVEEKLGVPIILRSGWYTFYGNALQKVTKTKENVKCFVNNKNGDVYFSTEDFPANIDNSGNIYRIVQSGTNSDGGNIWYNDLSSLSFDATVEIIKNNDAIKTVDLKPLAESLLKQIKFNNGFVIRANFVSGYIENENDWEFMVEFYASGDSMNESEVLRFCQNEWAASDMYAEYPYPTSAHDPLYSDVISEAGQWLVDSDNSRSQLYYFNSNGVQQKISETNTNIQYDHTQEDPVHWGNPLTTISTNYDHDDICTIKYPIQDGYYYTITGGFIYPINTAIAPAFSSRNIYSPNGDLLLEGKIFHTSATLTIAKISANKYLLGVKPSYNWTAYGTYEVTVYKLDYLNGGLYFIENGDITRIDGGENYMDYFHCLNQRLRPMKKYKNWQERIKTFDKESES